MRPCLGRRTAIGTCDADVCRIRTLRGPLPQGQLRHAAGHAAHRIVSGFALRHQRWVLTPLLRAPVSGHDSTTGTRDPIKASRLKRETIPKKSQSGEAGPPTATPIHYSPLEGLTCHAPLLRFELRTGLLDITMIQCLT